MSISPSGNQLLYVSPGSSSDETIYVVDLNSDAPPKAIVTMNEAKARLNGCDWATDERIVCDLYGMQEIGSTLLYFTRPTAMKSDGTDVTRLMPDTSRALGIAQRGGDVIALEVDGEDGAILMTRQYIKETSNNTRLANNKEGLGVDLVNVTTGRRKAVEDANRLADNYIADETGRIRIMQVSDRSAGGYDGNDVRYLFRTKGSDDWEDLSVLDARGDRAKGFYPVAVDSAKDVAYGFERVNGFNALFTVSLDGTGKQKLVMARDDVDVDGLERIGRNGRVVGATYATEKRTVEYFDPELDRIAKGLARALPDAPLVSIVDTDLSENRLVLIASSDTDPGTFYLYEKDTRQLSELLPARDPLVGREMGKMTPVTYTARDGTDIPGYLTLPPGSEGKNLPTVVLPHGGPGSRDVWGFDWLVQFLAARGYAVMQPNFRGSSGYGDAWFGKNGFQAWETAVGDVNDAGKWLVAEGIADPSKMAIAGWSYGGYAALQSQVADPDLFKAVVAIAPVTDLNLLVEENRRYTSYINVQRFVGTGPHVSSGSPARHADAFAAPVLLVHGTYDLNVGSAHSKLMEDRLEGAGKSVDYLEFEGLDHYLVHSQARGIMLKRMGEFLDTSLGR
uniref:alpha/beta hydrolase family protein n=1 Tax=Parerythrobacter lutipelagi TaxID=1964208 RepID=UPI001F006A0E|nr:S9 family peptidase [Parerythrobacter lutipelagi]